MKLYLLFVFLIGCHYVAMAQLQPATSDSSFEQKQDSPQIETRTYKNISQSLSIGSINSITIGRTTYNKKIAYYQQVPPEYYHPHTYWKDWKNRRSQFFWTYFAQLEEDPHEDLSTSTGRENKAMFAPGYHMLGEDSYESPYRLDNIVLLFSGDTLICLTANADTGIYYAMVRHCGKPDSAIVKRELKTLPTDTRYKVNLATRRYVWQHKGIKTEMLLVDALNKNGKKITIATYQMEDKAKYAAYLEKVNAEKLRLDKKYAIRE